MDNDVTVRVSTVGLLIGVGAFAFAAVATTIAALVVFTPHDPGLGGRYGTAYFAVGGLCGLVMAIWFAIVVGLAVASRERGLVRIHDDSVDVLTRHGRTSVPISSVTEVRLAEEREYLEVVLRDGTILVPVLRPEGGWSSSIEPLTRRIDASRRGTAGTAD